MSLSQITSKMISKFLLLSLALLSWVSPAVGDVDYDNLCPQEEIKLKNKLPPVLDQKRMNWCTTFACAAGLSYSARSLNPQLPDSFVFSPLHLNLVYDNKDTNLADHASLNKGGSIVELLDSVQRSPKPIKSDKGLPFPFTEHDEDLEKLVDDFERQLDEYIGKNPGKDLRVEFDIDPPLKGPGGHYTIDKALGHSQADTKETSISVSEDHLQIGDSLPRSVYPANYPDDASVYFQTRTLKGNRSEASYKKFFETLVEVLKKDQPAYIDTCANQLEKYRYERDKKELPKEWQEAIRVNACGPHQMLAVGVKRNTDGKCVVILQNSWGEDWADGGRVEIPFSKIVDFDKSHSSNRKNLTWVEPSKSKTLNNTLYFEDASEYVGPTQGLNPDNGEGRVKNYKVTFSDGNSLQYNGEVKVRRTGKSYYVLRHGQGSSSAEGGFYERGQYQEGQFLNGMTKKKLSSGEIFEGEFKDSRPYQGTLVDSTGVVSDVKEGYVYPRTNNRPAANPPSPPSVPKPTQMPSVVNDF